MMNYLAELHQEISKVAPIDGVSFGEEIRVDFASDATQEQQDLVLSNLPDLVLAAAKKNKIAALSKDCEAAICSGFTSEALGSPHHYNGQLDNQINLIFLGNAGLDVPYTCTDSAGIKEARLHTADQIRQVSLDGGSYKMSQMQKYRDLKALVEQATTPEEVEAIAW